MLASPPNVNFRASQVIGRRAIWLRYRNRFKAGVDREESFALCSVHELLSSALNHFWHFLFSLDLFLNAETLLNIEKRYCCDNVFCFPVLKF